MIEVKEEINESRERLAQPAPALPGGIQQGNKSTHAL
jgi:hypothetical protein